MNSQTYTAVVELDPGVLAALFTDGNRLPALMVVNGLPKGATPLSSEINAAGNLRIEFAIDDPASYNKGDLSWAVEDHVESARTPLEFSGDVDAETEHLG